MVTVPERVTHLEGMMGNLGDVTMADLVAQCTELATRLSALQTLHAEMQTSQTEMLSAHEDLVRDLQAKHEQQQRSLTHGLGEGRLGMAVSTATSSTHGHSAKCRAREVGGLAGASAGVGRGMCHAQERCA